MTTTLFNCTDCGGRRRLAGRIGGSCSMTCSNCGRSEEFPQGLPQAVQEEARLAAQATAPRLQLVGEPL